MRYVYECYEQGHDTSLSAAARSCTMTVSAPPLRATNMLPILLKNKDVGRPKEKSLTPWQAVQHVQGHKRFITCLEDD